MGFLIFNPYVPFKLLDFSMDILYEAYHTRFGDYFGQPWNPFDWIQIVATNYLGWHLVVFFIVLCLAWILNRCISGKLSFLSVRDSYSNLFAWYVLLAFFFLYITYLVVKVNFHASRYVVIVIPLFCVFLAKICQSVSNSIGYKKRFSFIAQTLFVGLLSVSLCSTIALTVTTVTKYIQRKNSAIIQISSFLKASYPAGTTVWKTEYTHVSDTFDVTGSDYFFIKNKVYYDFPQLLLISDYFFEFYKTNKHKKSEVRNKL